jgi:hypothetical protein
MSKNIKDIKQKIGAEKVEDILDKEWSVADIPTDEALAEEKHTSPKARSNKNSRANLVQYRKDKTARAKKTALKNLRYTEIEEDVDPKDVFGDGVDYQVFESVMPARDVLADRKEQEVYYNTLNLFLRDFDIDDLTFSDIDDIITLSLNQVLIYRLMRASRDNPKLVLEISQSVEKFRRQSEKIKSSLASRRVDRIDIKHKKLFSIVDLAAAFDERAEDNFRERIKKLKEEEKDHVPWDPDF